MEKVTHDELKKAIEASLGAWQAVKVGTGSYVFCANDKLLTGPSDANSANNVAFIVASRAAVSEPIDEVRKLQKINKDLLSWAHEVNEHFIDTNSIYEDRFHELQDRCEAIEKENKE